MSGIFQQFVDQKHSFVVLLITQILKPEEETLRRRLELENVGSAGGALRDPN